MNNTKKILVYAKDGIVTIVSGDKVTKGENAFEPGPEATIGNAMYNLARVLNTCAKTPDQLFEIAIIGNVFSKVASPILKKEYYSGHVLSTKAPLTERELEVYSLTIQAMQKAYCNTILMDMQYVPRSTTGKVGESLEWARMAQLAQGQYKVAPKAANLDGLKELEL